MVTGVLEHVRCHIPNNREVLGHGKALTGPWGSYLYGEAPAPPPCKESVERGSFSQSAFHCALRMKMSKKGAPETKAAKARCQHLSNYCCTPWTN